MIIRDAQKIDFNAITNIYAYYVLNSSATAECCIPSVETMVNRFEAITKKKYPYLVAEHEGQILGYAYVTDFAEREAYQYSTSFTVYLANEAKGKGVGKQLLQAIDERVKQLNIHNLVALISGDNEESIKFHQKNEFKEIGRFPHSMRKFNRWVDLVWYLKQYPIVLTDEDTKITLKPVKSVEQIQELFTVLQEIWKEVFTPIIGAEQVAYMLTNYQSIENITEEIANGAKYFLLTYQNLPVGYTAYEALNDQIYISKLYLHANYRGKGLMSAIFDYYESIAGDKTLHLNVNQNNRQAIAVYEHRGFKRVGERYVDIGKGYIMNDFIYEKAPK